MWGCCAQLLPAANPLPPPRSPVPAGSSCSPAMGCRREKAVPRLLPALQTDRRCSCLREPDHAQSNQLPPASQSSNMEAPFLLHRCSSAPCSPALSTCIGLHCFSIAAAVKKALPGAGAPRAVGCGHGLSTLLYSFCNQGTAASSPSFGNVQRQQSAQPKQSELLLLPGLWGLTGAQLQVSSHRRALRRSSKWSRFSLGCKAHNGDGGSDGMVGLIASRVACNYSVLVCASAADWECLMATWKEMPQALPAGSNVPLRALLPLSTEMLPARTQDFRQLVQPSLPNSTPTHSHHLGGIPGQAPPSDGMSLGPPRDMLPAGALVQFGEVGSCCWETKQ